MPPDFGVYKVIEENLRYMGFSQVTVLAPAFQYKFKDRLLNFMQKSLFKNRAYKKQLIDTYYNTEVCSALSSSFAENSVDYAIVIRPDKLNATTISHLHTVANKVIAYQWDGLARFPKVFKVIPLFKHFFVFDPEDYNRYKYQYPNLLLCTNFYFDASEEKTLVNKNEVMYVGVYIQNRIDSLLKIVNKLSEYTQLSLNINLFNRGKDPLHHPYITFFSKGISYTQYLNFTKKAAILLDIKTIEHSGLSFRTFEAIKYEKKLITDNLSVKQYDFYHPNNFYVFEDDNFEGLTEFLENEYMPLAKNIKEKYSFESWVKCALEV